MTTAASAQPTLADINASADRAAAQLGEHKASYAAAREANVAASYATTDPATQAAVGNIGKNSTVTSIAAGAMWWGGYALLPQPVRKWYAYTTALIILGLVTTDLDGWDRASYHERYNDTGVDWGAWKAFIGVPTVWSIIFWALAAFCIYKWVTVARAVRRWHLAQQQEPVVEEPAPAPVVEQEPAPAPAPRPAPTEASKLWIPEPSRRVRRGGTTLSGVPIKDRRAVDPRTL